MFSDRVGYISCEEYHFYSYQTVNIITTFLKDIVLHVSNKKILIYLSRDIQLSHCHHPQTPSPPPTSFPHPPNGGCNLL